MTGRKAFAVGCVAIATSLGAADYYVDVHKGNDSRDGTLPTEPLKTLKAAVEKAPSGSTIHVAPGVYSEGEMWDGYNTNRVYITKANVAIVSDKGRDVTFIEGHLSTLDPSTKCGSDAVRAVHITGSGSYIKGFTIRNGSTVADSTTNGNGYGGAVNGGAVIDCVITNCATGFRGAVHGSVLISSLIYPIIQGTYEVNGCSVYNCVFKGGSVSYGNGIVLNCTYLGDGPRGQAAGTKIYNSFIRVARKNTDLRRCYCIEGTIEAQDDGTRKITADEANLDSATGRPKKGSVLIDAGNDTYYDSYESAYKAAFAQYDFAFKPRRRGSAVDVGAVEYDYAEEFADALTDSDFFKVVDSSAEVWTNGASCVEVPSGAFLTGMWANPSGAGRPSEVSFTAEATEDAVLKVYLNGGEEPTWTIAAADGAKTVTYLSSTDDTLKFVCEGSSGIARLSAFTSTAHACVYADAVNGNDDWDGSIDYARRDETAGRGPTKSLQRAVNVAEAGGKIYAATGVYDRVETWYDGCSNRLAVGKANLGIIAIGSQEDTVIEGALDSSNENGCGPAAVRCVYFSSSSASGSYVRGFTLRNGRTANVNSDAAGNKGAAIYGGMAVDCHISNCGSGFRGIVNGATAIRCKVESATSGTYALYQSKAFNCVSSANYNYGVGPYLNCSFLAAAPQGQGSSANLRAQLYNCYVYGSRKWGAYHRCYSDNSWSTDNTTIDDDCKRISAASVALDATTRRPNAGSALVDMGSDAYYETQKALLPAAAQAFLDEDFAGGQRVYNGAIDVGAGERDWRGDFADRLKHSRSYELAVAQASPAVTTNALGGVTLADGATAVVDWTVDVSGEMSFAAVQTGEGTLSATCNGAPVAVDPTTHRGVVAVASGSYRLVFAFSGSGSVALSDFHAPGRGTIVIVH